MSSSAPIEYLAHLLTIPVRVAGTNTRFVFDTGIGLSLVAQSLANRVGCVHDGSSFTGRRMSGHPVTIPLGRLASLGVGDHRAQDVPVGIFDMQTMAGLEGVEGFLSLTYFRDAPVTIDYPAGRLVIEDEASLAARAAAGLTVPVEVRRDGHSTEVLLSIDLPSGKTVKAEVDTGSDELILNDLLAADAGVDLLGEGVRRASGTDETGHEFVRYFTALTGQISVTGAPRLRLPAPQVMFQRIIHDGLAGDKFLRNFTVTYDLPGSRMIFSPART